MMYRAKITSIQSWVKDIYRSNCRMVHDIYDYYLEVPDEEEADMVENLDQAAEDLLQHRRWRKIHEK